MNDTALTTSEIAAVVGIEPHALAAAVTKLWWSYLDGQDAQVGSGRRRTYQPVDAVVVDMLDVTGALGGELVDDVREHLAERIYDHWSAHQDTAAPLPETLSWPADPHQGGPLVVTIRPAWFLTTHPRIAS